MEQHLKTACSSSGQLRAVGLPRRRHASKGRTPAHAVRRSHKTAMLLATPRRRRAVYVSCSALIATVSLSRSRKTRRHPHNSARLALPSAPRSAARYWWRCCGRTATSSCTANLFTSRTCGRAARTAPLNVNVDDVARRRRAAAGVPRRFGKAARNRRVVGSSSRKHLDWKRPGTFLIGRRPSCCDGTTPSRSTCPSASRGVERLGGVPGVRGDHAGCGARSSTPGPSTKPLLWRRSAGAGEGNESAGRPPSDVRARLGARTRAGIP